MTHAYSTLTIKSVTDSDDERIITGIATTPSTDRDDDILEPTGAKLPCRYRSFGSTATISRLAK